MDILFVIVLVYASHLVRAVAVDQQTGYNPNPFGTTIFCLFLHLLLLTLCIWYLGWIWGILIFMCHLFGIIHMTISWIFDVPGLLAKNTKQLIGFMKLKVAILTPMVIVTLFFAILSFFVVDHKSLFYLLSENTFYIVVAGIVAVVFGIIRLFAAKALSGKY